MCNEKSSELAVRERELNSVQSEVVRLTEQLTGCTLRLEEREASAGREQSRSEGLLESLRSEFSQTRSSLEERCRGLVAEVAELREEGARRDGEAREREREGERLQSLLQQATQVHTHTLIDTP